MTDAPPPLLELVGVSRRFGSVDALRDVSVAIHPGEVTCLVGDNGAGKSTLIRILAGVHPPTAGTLRFAGRDVRLDSPRAALALGIATVYQDLAVVPLMSVWRNFFLGAEPRRGSGPLAPIDVATCRRIAAAELAHLGIVLADVEQPVGTLSGGERQALAIARALYFGAKVLILDEPTAALGLKQTAIVLEQIRTARGRGAAVVLITHNPAHAAAIGDRFVVLRQGRVVATVTRGDADPARLGALMAGELPPA